MKRNLLFLATALFVVNLEVVAQQETQNAITSHSSKQSSKIEIIDSIPTPRNSFRAKLKESNFHMGLELQTKYIWRGIEYATAPVLFSQMSYSNWGLNIYAMGGYAVNDSHAEVDLGISYTFYGITIGLNDYYYPTEVGTADKYFNFKRGETGHSLEACIGYYPEKLPFWILASTYVAGADMLPESGKNAYSSYLEAGVHYDFLNNHQIALACGMALNKSFYNNYEKNFSVNNVMLQYTYNLQINWWTLPLKAALVYNPYLNKVYFTASLYFGF